MQDTIHNRAETAAINSAWTTIEYEAECRSWSWKPRIRDAFKRERKERGATLAKALCVECFLQGARDNPTAVQLAMLADGLQVMAMFGAETMANCLGRSDDAKRLHYADMFAKLQAASAAHQTYLDRRFERLSQRKDNP